MNSGFKQKLAGLIPNDWGTEIAGHLFFEKDNRSSNTKKYPLFSLTIENGVTPKTERYERGFLLKDKENNEFKIVDIDDIVFNPMNLRFGAIAKSKIENTVLVSAYYNVIRYIEGKADPDYYVFLFRTARVNYIFDTVSIGSLLEKRRVHWSIFKRIELPCPHIIEQKAIAKVLLTWEDAIEQTKALITQKELRKKWLMQQLLTGKKRLKGFRGKWKTKALDEVLAPVARAIEKPSSNFLALGIRSHGKGTFLKPEFNPAKIEMDLLYQVKENDLIVNITFAWEGAIAIAGSQDDGALVSHRFPTFIFKEEHGIVEYFRHLIVQPRIKFMLGLISPGGAGRNRVLNQKDFLRLELRLPEVDEQSEIAAVLNAADNEIQILKVKLEKLQAQKKGLMQQLLMGKRRIKVIGE